MSFASPAAGGGKIGIGGAVRDAYVAVLDNGQLAIELAWLPFTILAAAEVVALLIGGGGWFGLILAALVRGFGFAVFGSAFIVRWHRFMLLGERSSATLFPPGWGPFFLAAVKVGLSVFVGMVLLSLIAAAPPHFLTGLIALAGVVGLIFASARVSLAFPAAAVERPISLREAWDLATGNTWRLLACLLACYVPFGIVQVIVHHIGEMAGSILWVIFEIVGLAVSFAGVAVVASLLSAIYRAVERSGAPAAEARLA